MPITLTIAGYCTAWILLIRGVRLRTTAPATVVLGMIFLSLVAHGWGLYTQIVKPEGFQFSFVKIASLFFWVANLLVFAACIRRPLHNLFLLSIPVTAIALLISLFSTSNAVTPAQSLTPGVVGHILLSLTAYSTMIVATLQAVALAYQNHKIRNKHPTGLVRLLPPLQTMEHLLFELVWTGQILLSGAMVSGLLQITSLTEQHLLHKVVFTACAWLTYSLLLWGHHFKGWRGKLAIRWTLTGFAFLILAYFGTKFVLELILKTNSAG